MLKKKQKAQNENHKNKVNIFDFVFFMSTKKERLLIERDVLMKKKIAKNSDFFDFMVEMLS